MRTSGKNTDPGTGIDLLPALKRAGRFPGVKTDPRLGTGRAQPLIRLATYKGVCAPFFC